MSFKKNMAEGLALAGFSSMSYMSEEMAKTAYKVARDIEEGR